MDLHQAFPETFTFYHLGEVTREAGPATASSPADWLSQSDQVFIAYRFVGDFRGLFLIRFDRGLDVSVYAELGNVLASRAATRLSEQSERDVLISPPRVLEEETLRKLRGLEAGESLSCTYLHRGSELIPVETLMIGSGPVETDPAGGGLSAVKGGGNA